MADKKEKEEAMKELEKSVRFTRKILGKDNGKDDEMIDLEEALVDVAQVEEFLKEAINHDMEVDPEYILLMVRIIKKRIQYLSEKYKFQVEKSDLVYLSDFPDVVDMRG